MNWVSAYHYAAILQEERLRRADKPGKVLDLDHLCKWLSTWRETFAVRGHTRPRMAPAQE